MTVHDETGPALRGFAVTVRRGGSGASRCVPAFTHAGPVAGVELGPGTHGWWVGPGAGAASPARGRGVAVIIVGELYHRERLLEAVGEVGEVADAELVLALWEAFGRTALRMLNGRFALLVRTGSEVLVATDHAGGVPVLVSSGPDGWGVATEAKCLLPSDGDPVSGTVPAAGRRQVVQVRGATVVELDPVSGATRSWRTWSAPQHREPMRPEQASRELLAALDAAVATRVRPSCTVLLSGGVDSGAVTALAAARGPVRSLSMGTEVADELDAATTVARHVGSRHEEVLLAAGDVVAALPWTVAAAEVAVPDIVEYLMPLVALYRAVAPTRTILTGYGADIPLGGMHRGVLDHDALDATIVADLQEVDVLNEMSPVVGGSSGHWTTHPYWDRDVLDVLLRCPPGLKKRAGTDKWVLRNAVSGVLPASTCTRSKLGVHEGSGSQGAWTARLLAVGVPAGAVREVKRRVVTEVHELVVDRRVPPTEVDLDAVVAGCVRTSVTV